MTVSEILKEGGLLAALFLFAEYDCYDINIASLDNKDLALRRRCVGLIHIPSKAQASAARHEGVGTIRGLINGLIFTLGFWIALTGFVLLILR